MKALEETKKQKCPKDSDEKTYRQYKEFLEAMYKHMLEGIKMGNKKLL
jgi:hypothetical protein